jgi:uncharacterized protein YcbK (DUF882 family)
MKLSTHFTLAELTVTSRKIDNTPNSSQIKTLTSTAQSLEKVRELLGKPIKVNSGYRSPSVNKAVGGSPTSAHVLCYAVDFVCPDFGSPKEICAAINKAGIKYDQLILEPSWVHISFDPRMRQQYLIKK